MTPVVDGDTIVVEGIGTLRLIGVDTPETVDPRRPVQAFWKEASEFTKAMALDKIVRLDFDVTRTDCYGRTLAYVCLPKLACQYMWDLFLASATSSPFPAAILF